MSKRLRSIQPVIGAGLLLGCGLGALFDGILLHQILQWHNMLSNVHPPSTLASMKYNMLWDGLFHAVAWIVTVLGAGQLWGAVRRPDVRWSNHAFAGAGLSGWGAFNVLEGIIDHQMLALHHVRPGELQEVWDLGFLAWGAAMLLAGFLLVRRATQPLKPHGIAYYDPR